MISVGRIEEAAAAFETLDRADRHRRHLIRRPRSATLEPPAMRRRFSFALRVLDVAARDPAAGRSGPPSAGRDRWIGTGIRRPRPAVRHPRRPMSLGAPAYRVIPASSRRQKSPPAGHGRRALWPTAWAMFQTNNTSVFPTGPNCPIIPRKVAYIFVRGPYDQTRRPVGRGA
jgi:hypothetical protein